MSQRSCILSGPNTQTMMFVVVYVFFHAHVLSACHLNAIFCYPSRNIWLELVTYAGGKSSAVHGTTLSCNFLAPAGSFMNCAALVPQGGGGGAKSKCASSSATGVRNTLKTLEHQRDTRDRICGRPLTSGHFPPEQLLHCTSLFAAVFVGQMACRNFIRTRMCGSGQLGALDTAWKSCM